MTSSIGLKYEDFVKICRLCCKKSNNLAPIYHKIEDTCEDFWNVDNASDEPNSIESMLFKIGLTVNKNDELPTNLCSDCREKLLSCNTFREQCLASEVYLQDILDKHKEFVEVKSESSVDYTQNFDNIFEIDYLDQNELDTADTHNSINGRLETLEITMAHLSPIRNIKRKRGRPKLEKPPKEPVKLTKICKTKKKYERKDVCLVCGKVINNNMKGHQAIHDKSETFVCDICGFETNVKLYMKTHMQKMHIAQRQYPCPHCHLIFMHAVTLKRHATIHTGEKNFVCEECGKSYRQRDMLIAHRKRHLPPTIQCSYCDKLFYSKNELKSHTGLHTGIKAFKCDICGAAFVASSSLAAHRRQHKKENVLPSCKLCGMEFSDRLVYKMHLMDHKRKDQSIAYNSRQ